MGWIIEVMRHGDAEPRSPEGDAGRSLTPLGRKRIGEMAARLAASGWRPDRVYTSPLRRAHETASILMKALRDPPLPLLLEPLEPEGEPDEVVESLDLPSAAGRLLIVGHLPCVERLVYRWTGQPVAFAPGTLVRLELPDHPGAPGRIVAVLDPVG